MTDGLLRLDVGPVAHGGFCVARHPGSGDARARVVFVRHALPGEEVLARLDEGSRDGDRFWRADAVEVLRASPDRVVPRCALSGPGGCGGCDWQHASLPAQRRLKADVVREQLRRLAGLDQWEPEPDSLADGPADGPADDPADHAEGPLVEAVPGDVDGLGWRTRVRFAVDPQGRPGLHRHRSHEVVPVEHCPIAHPSIDALGVGRRRWPGAAAVEVVAGSVGVPLVVVEPAAPGGRVDPPPLPAATSLARVTPEGLQRVRGRTWVEERVVEERLVEERVVEERLVEERLVEGRLVEERVVDEGVEERADDGVGRGVEHRFRVTGTGFWQVHPGAAATLLAAVLDATRPAPGERAVDLYCGVGLFSAGLAGRVGGGGAVLGIEADARACADARRSLHHLPQLTLVSGRVEQALGAATRVAPWQGRADVVVLDPPRTGAGRRVVEAVARLRPRVVAYVACDPAALARDVATAAGLGYRLSGLRAFDLFPMTHHVECVATLVPKG